MIFELSTIDHTVELGSFWIGFDCGQARDYSAMSILQREGQRYVVKHLERLPLDMPYPKQIEYIFQLMHRKPLDEANRVLAIDYTGVGRPVVDLAEDRGLNPIGISLTCGNSASWNDERNRARVPKRDLVNLLQIFAQDDRLKIAKDLPAGQILASELQNFRVKIDLRTAHDSYGTWREGEHDDLILATAIPLWTAENLAIQPTHAVARFISNGRGW